jgi:pyruvate/2-oxoglutarate dehydrogenase complex dihydrolipoamide acyltransferase (E2) component
LDCYVEINITLFHAGCFSGPPTVQPARCPTPNGRNANSLPLARYTSLRPSSAARTASSPNNVGIFGIEWGTPIPLPDQTLLLGLGVGKKVRSWDETKNEFVSKTEAQITLSFDRRSIDGGGASRLLKRVIELLQDPPRL